MMFQLTLLRVRAARLAWTATMLALMLQKTPILRILFHPQMISGLRSGQMIRAALPAAAAVAVADTVHAQSGATTMTFNPASPVSGMTGTHLAIAFAFTGGSATPESYAIIGVLPPGMTVPNATGPAGNLTLNSTMGGSIEGTPTTAGSYTVSVEAFDGPDRSLGTEGRSGEFNLTINIEASEVPPAFTVHPQSQTVDFGATVNLTVTVSGEPEPTLQWRKDGANITGATEATLTLDEVVEADSGSYDVVATNSSGSVTSNAATLTVNPPVAPSITQQPATLNLNEGATATFSVTVDGSPAPTIQWQRSTDGGSSWDDLDDGTIGASGTQSTSLELALITFALNTNQFRAVASNVAGTVNSAPATLGVTAIQPEAPPDTDRTDTNPTGFTATWDAVFNATGYRIDVSTSADFSSFVPGFEDLDVGNVTDFDISGLSAGTYHYRVRAYNSAGISSSSEALTVGVGGRVVNLSTRGRTADGEGTLIIGFVIKGSGNKPLLIRASGPSLSVLGLNDGTVPNPRLALFQQSGTPIPPGNDDWDHTDAALQAAIGSVFAFPFLEPSVDAAMLVDLPAGIYTVHAQTVTGEPGVTSVELYELDDTAELINVSTRAFVGEGIEVLIPGTFVGTAPKRVLVRAVGETLADLGVNGVLEDPVLEVVPLGQSMPLIANDDWGSEGNEAEIVAASAKVFAFPLPSGSRDAVVLTDLPTGGFTFVVSGKDGATGIVLVELYVVP